MNRLAAGFSVLALASVLVAGCQGEGPNQTAGGLIGGAAGAVVGAQFGKGSGQLAATALGAVLGAYVGSNIGRHMDDEDRRRALEAQQRAYAAPIGSVIAWNNPSNGHAGTITPTRDGTDAQGDYCREFQTSITIDGQSQPATGTACRQPDGTWKIVQ